MKTNYFTPATSIFCVEPDYMVCKPESEFGGGNKHEGPTGGAPIRKLYV